MPTIIEQKVPYDRDVAIPLAEVHPGEDLIFRFVSVWLEEMNFLAKCMADDQQSDLFIVREDDVDRRKNGLVVIKNGSLIPISSLHSGQSIIFQLKRKPDSPIANIKVSHLRQPNPHASSQQIT